MGSGVADSGYEPHERKSMASGLKFSLQKILLIFNQQRRPVSKTEREFCNRWLNDRFDTIATIGVVLAFFYHVLSIFTDRFVVTSEVARWYLLYCHLGVLLFLALWFSLASRFRLSIRHTNIPLQLISVFGYLITLNYYIEMSGGLDEKVIKAWTGYIVLCVFLLLHTAYRGRILVILAILYWAGAWYCWSKIETGPGILVITAFIFTGTLNFKWAYSMSYRYEALREYENRKLLREAEQQKFAHELELARQIQDSLSPPVSLVSERLRAVCLQLKHSSVGGDWVGLREQADNSIIVAVADATGKGMQAALVVHALQSLWAEALDHPDFDPERWLQRVNLTMLRLGEKQTHSLSMGLLRINGTEITYWSAGHIPLIIGESIDGVENYVAVSGRGMFLGLSKEFSVTPGRYLSSSPNKLTLLLGTDGVFERGTATRPREIAALLQRLRSDPESALASCHAEDDRTLVWMEAVG